MTENFAQYSPLYYVYDKNQFDTILFHTNNVLEKGNSVNNRIFNVSVSQINHYIVQLPNKYDFDVMYTYIYGLISFLLNFLLQNFVVTYLYTFLIVYTHQT